MSSEVGRGSARWTVGRIVLAMGLVVATYLLASVVGVAIALTLELAANPDLSLEVWNAQVAENGFVLSVVTLASAALCVPTLLGLVGRVESRPWSFLGFTPVPLRSYLVWGLALLAFAVASDLLTMALGRSVVPAFMSAAYASSGSTALLFLSLTCAAPLVEEIVFRGFLMSVLRARALAIVWCAVLPAGLWALLHTQYDAYLMVTVFVFGLLLAWARMLTGSILPPLLMHGLLNAVALSQAALAARAASS